MLSQKNSRKIKVLSFLLFVGVMTIHTYNLEVYNIEASSGNIAVFETYVNKLASSLCVPYFFVLSGFLFFRNFDFSLLITKYKSRFHSVLIPYFVWNTLYYFFFVVITRCPFLTAFVNGGVTEFSIRAYVDYVWNGYYIFWFLRALIWMIICTPLLWLLLKRRKNYWPEAILMVLVILNLIEKSILEINIYYAFGAYVGMNGCDLLNKSSRKTAVLGSGMFLAALALGGFFAGNVIYNCIVMISSWYALDLLSFSQDIKWWMECTFFYYCAHDMILESIEKVILIVFGKSEAMAMLDFLIAPILTLIVLICTAWFLKRNIRVVWNILNGRR